MNPFEAFCTDTIYIRHQDGRATGPLKASFGKNKFTVWDSSLDVSEGDLIERLLPNGKAERYDIVHVHFSTGLHQIPPSYDFEVRKQGSLVQFQKPSVTNISIAHSQGFQVGDHNTQNIVDSFKEILHRIDQSTASAEEKREAKSLFRAFLTHPLTSTAVGSAITGLLALAK